MARDQNDKSDQIEITHIFALPCRPFLFQKYHILAKNEQNDQNFDILGFFTFLDKSCDHFFGPQDVRKWHILGPFLDPFLTTSWQIPTPNRLPYGGISLITPPKGVSIWPLFLAPPGTLPLGVYTPIFWTIFGSKMGKKRVPNIWCFKAIVKRHCLDHKSNQ